MQFQLTLNFQILSLTAIAALGIAGIVWRRRSTPASQPFLLLMVAIAGYAWVAAMEAGSTQLSHKVFWSTLEYVGSGSVITLFLIFAAQFTQQLKWLTRRKIWLLWLLPLLDVVIVATNHWHHLVWTDFSPAPGDPHSIIYQHGIGFFWIMAVVYVYSCTGAILLIRAALRPSRLTRHQSMLLLLGAIIPLLGSALYLFDKTPPGLNITPMSFLLTGLIYLTSVTRFQMFDLVPVARDILIERMSDGVLVLDAYHRIVDTNPAALTLLQTTHTCIGQSVNQILPESLQATLQTLRLDPLTQDPICTLPNHRFIEVQVTALHDRRSRLTGELVIIRDVTQRQLGAIAVRQANEQLQQQLSEIERLHQQLHYQATRDGLTGLLNRRYFEEMLQQELGRAHPHLYPIALILLDIDYFKRINDTYGHQSGDRVLQAFADLLRAHARSSDIVCRYGGEEFVIALPNMNLDQALQRAEKIRLAVQQLVIQHDEQPITTTVSSGVGVFPTNGATQDGLLRQVDQALYAAKAAGRNQVYSCNDLALAAAQILDGRT